ncbi:hypothetical protein [Tsuneonella mangrovi]|uniref:hypothetical protein n=1 Tax=Tsuneonella mangrovi TaxID=1982042 RepID=UPI000BA28EB9|nr:hypothetical protein [Tsuneonella mangrovi]
MPEHSFIKRWGALFFVVILAAGVVAFMGRDGVASAVTGQKPSDASQPVDGLAAGPRDGANVDASAPSDDSTVVEWSDNDDLIDDTAGIDPTPPDAMTDDEGTVIEGQSPVENPDASVAPAPDGANLPPNGGNP